MRLRQWVIEERSNGSRCRKNSSRTLEMVTVRPSRLRAAVAPAQAPSSPNEISKFNLSEGANRADGGGRDPFFTRKIAQRPSFSHALREEETGCIKNLSYRAAPIELFTYP
jgi:hypothetical protein